jgi:hypothetical protein
MIFNRIDQNLFNNTMQELKWQEVFNIFCAVVDDTNLILGLSDMVQNVALGYQQVVTPKFNEAMDFGSWRPTHELGMSCEPIADFEAQKTTSANSHIRDSAAFKPSLSGHRDSMDERLDSLLERVEDAGFENFDSLVTAYYSSTFPESSPLYIEQSLSRERRLSRVLWEIFRSPAQWADREREGFNEEITKISESILIAESCSAHSVLVCRLEPLMVDSHDGPTDITPQRIIEMKRTVTNEVSVWNISKL